MTPGVQSIINNIRWHASEYFATLMIATVLSAITIGAIHSNRTVSDATLESASPCIKQRLLKDADASYNTDGSIRVTQYEKAKRICTLLSK